MYRAYIEELKQADNMSNPHLNPLGSNPPTGPPRCNCSCGGCCQHKEKIAREGEARVEEDEATAGAAEAEESSSEVDEYLIASFPLA